MIIYCVCHSKGGSLLNISSDAIRGYIDLIVLSFLINQDMYGYEIAKEVSKISEGQYELNEATMYSGFRRLEKNNLIISYFKDNSLRGGKRRYYQITDLGKDYYHEKCAEWRYIKKIVNLFVWEDI